MYNELRIDDLYMWNALATLDLWRTRSSPTDLLRLTVKPNVALESILGKTVSLRIGYTAGELSPVFVGKITQASGLFIEAKDAIAHILRTNIMQTFLQVTPQEIIRYIFSAAGIQDATLSAADFAKRERVVIASLDGMAAIKRVNRLWGIDLVPTVAVLGDVSWIDLPPVPDEMPHFEYGKNILELENQDDTVRLVTIGVPFVDHSTWIAITHPRVSVTEAIVDTVHHYTTEQGALRTELYFKVA